MVELLLERPPDPGSFWNVNLPQPDDPSPAIPQIVFCPVDPHPLPINYEVRDGKLHYRAQYHDRLRASGHDVEACFAGHIAVSQIGLHWIPLGAVPPIDMP